MLPELLPELNEYRVHLVDDKPSFHDGLSH